MTMKQKIKGIDVVVDAERIGFNTYRYVAKAFLKPSPIVSKGIIRGCVSAAVCKGFNSIRSAIRQMEDM